MERPFNRITFKRHGNTVCVRLATPDFDVAGMEDFGAEMGRLLEEHDCHHIVLILGPNDPDCLYSLFLAKLILLKRRLEAVGGNFVLANASDNVRQIFVTTGLDKLFTFYPDEQAALKALAG